MLGAQNLGPKLARDPGPPPGQIARCGRGCVDRTDAKPPSTTSIECGLLAPPSTTPRRLEPQPMIAQCLFLLSNSLRLRPGPGRTEPWSSAPTSPAAPSLAVDPAWSDRHTPPGRLPLQTLELDKPPLRKQPHWDSKHPKNPQRSSAKRARAKARPSRSEWRS